MRARRGRAYDADDTQPWLVPPPVPDAPGLHLFGGIVGRWWIVALGFFLLAAIVLADTVGDARLPEPMNYVLLAAGFGGFILFLLLSIRPRRRR